MEVLRRPLLGICIVLTAITGLAIIAVGIASYAANTKTFGTGVGLALLLYGLMLLGIAWAASRGYGWALGLIVASSLLHALSVGSFLTTQDRTQFILMLIVAPFVAATVITSVWATGRGEIDRVNAAARRRGPGSR